MRFSRLELLKYGHFDGCDVEFPDGDPDFHIVFGPNEAGKSTMMAAIGDILFGFPNSTTYDFLHDRQLLRVGAVLQGGAGDFACRRKKGRKFTLIDGDDNLLDEGRLAALLGGYTTETFHRMFSLDHRRLRDGGRAIIDAKDDVGQAIFAAGSGLVGVARILENLEIESKAIWTKRASNERRYYVAQNAHDEARARLKQAQIRPAAWDDLRKSIEELERTLAEKKERRADCERRRSGVERRRRVLPHAALYRDAAALLEPHRAAPALPADAAEILKRAIQAVGAADVEVRLSTERRDKLRATRAAITFDRRLIDRHDAIQSLRESKGGIDKSIADLPRRRTELATRQSHVGRLQRELGWSHGTSESIAASLPGRTRLAEIRSLLERRVGIDARLEAANEAMRKAQATLGRLGQTLGALARPRDVTALAAALKQANGIGDIDEAVAGAERESDRRAALLAAAIGQLAPWRGNADALRAFAGPDSQEVTEFVLAFNTARSAVNDAKRDLRAELDRSETMALSRTQLLREDGAVTREAVRDARENRDTLWRGLAGHLRDESRLADPTLAAAAFEESIGRADDLTDRRFDAAEQSARLMVLDDEIEHNRLAIDQRRREQARAEAAQAALESAWAARLGPSGVALDAKAFGVWLERRKSALGLADEEERARGVATDGRRRRDAAKARLAAEMVTLAASPPDNAGFRAICDAASVLEKSEAATERQRAEIEGKTREADEARRESNQRLEAANSELSRWGRLWDAAIRAASLDPAQSHAVIRAQLELLDELRAEIDEVRSLEHRIEAMSSDIKIFDEDVRSAAETCGLETGERSTPDMLMQLANATAEARAASSKHDELEKEIGEAEQAIEEANATRERALALIKPLFAAVGTEDRVALQEAIHVSETVRRLAAELERLRMEILRAGEGPSLEQLLGECEQADAQALTRMSQGLLEDIGSLSEEIAKLTGEHATNMSEFQRLDVGPDAAVAAADAELARAEMAEQAEAYVRKRAEAALLRWAIAEYRSSKQAPLLLRASELFSRLTLGRFERLLVDLDGDTSRLAGITRDNGVVSVAGMSEGTVDQLFLALRVAAVEDAVANGARLPFLADDLFINYDDDRARAGFEVLAELARRTQVLFFSHHQHLLSVAERALAPLPISKCVLARRI